MSLKLEHMQDEALSAQNPLDIKLEEEYVKPRPAETEEVDKPNSWEEDCKWEEGEDMYSNVSTFVPYTEGTATTTPPQVHQNSISKLGKTVDKLAKKYSVPEEKRKPRNYARKVKPSHIVPKIFLSLYNHIANSDPEPSNSSLTLFKPWVDWSKVDMIKGKNLPKPELYPVHSAPADPNFYNSEWYKQKLGTRVSDGTSDSLPCKATYKRLSDGTYGLTHCTCIQCQHLFGSLPGVMTNHGILPMDPAPIHGHVFSVELKRWVVYAGPG